MTLTEKLDREIEIKGEANCILLNPTTYNHFIKGLTIGELTCLINIKYGRITYKDIPMFRTTDVEENKFIVY